MLCLYYAYAFHPRLFPFWGYQSVAHENHPQIPDFLIEIFADFYYIIIHNYHGS